MKFIILKNILLTSIITLTLFSVHSCKKTPPTEPQTNTDKRLEKLMNNSSEGIGYDYYLLPKSNNYASIPQDPKNPITREKVELGKLLFHETKLAIEPKYPEGKFTYSCSSCHHSKAGFQPGKRQGIADGGIGFGFMGEDRTNNPIYPEDSLDVQPIKAPSTINSAYQQVVFWNGQFGATGPNTGTQSQWTSGTLKERNFLGFEGVETQAIAGLEGHRMNLDTSFINNSDYKSLFDRAFPNVPESERYTRITAGLAIAAYERTLLSNEGPFQEYLHGNHSAVTANQKSGAILFFGKAGCVKCHNGPALNNMEFQALGLNDLEGADILGPGPDEATQKGRGGFTGNSDDDYKFKVPQLYSLRYSNSYGHGSSFASIKEIIKYKNMGVKENMNVPDNQLSNLFVPLHLTDAEVDQLTVKCLGRPHA